MRILIFLALFLSLGAGCKAGTVPSATDTVPAPTLRRLPPLDTSKLERFTSSYAQPSVYADLTAYRDDKHGVSVEVEFCKQTKPPIMIGGGSRFYEDGGAKWILDRYTLPDRVVTTRMRLTAETLTNLIMNPDAPVHPRYIALRQIYSVEGFAQADRFKMIEVCSRDVQPGIRSMAVIKATEYKPLCDTVPILCRSLCDPIGHVAAFAGSGLSHYFFPVHVTPEFITGQFTPDDLDRMYHKKAFEVARKIHALHPDLVTAEDVATIESHCQERQEKPDLFPGFFGLPLGGASKIVFLIDRSVSMTDSIGFVKLELKRCIRMLSQEQQFCVIFHPWATPVEVPGRTLVPPTAHNRQLAFQFIDEVIAQGETDPSQAIERAFACGPDLIYLLTDGKFDKDIVGLIKQLNIGGKVKVHTIGFLNARGEEVLKQIAAENNGNYRFVFEADLIIPNN